MARIDTFQEFAGLIRAITARTSNGFTNYNAPFKAERHCPHCHEQRKQEARLLFPSIAPRLPGQPDLLDELLPGLFTLLCLQCDTRSTGLLFRGPNGNELAVFPTVKGGLTTVRTPDPVAYYLDQAARSHAANANSAAVAMYRAALDHMLHDKGFTGGTCGVKVAALKAKIEAGEQPEWATRMDPNDTKVLTELGNYSIHTNDGAISRQDSYDAELVRAVEVSMSELLDRIYERPHRENERREKLAASLSKIAGKQ